MRQDENSLFLHEDPMQIVRYDDYVRNQEWQHLGWLQRVGAAGQNVMQRQTCLSSKIRQGHSLDSTGSFSSTCIACNRNTRTTIRIWYHRLECLWYHLSAFLYLCANTCLQTQITLSIRISSARPILPTAEELAARMQAGVTAASDSIPWSLGSASGSYQTITSCWLGTCCARSSSRYRRKEGQGVCPSCGQLWSGASAQDTEWVLCTKKPNTNTPFANLLTVI